MLVASQRQLYDAEQAYIKGDGPAFLAYGIGGYTDMVQMIGIAACEDEKKLSACMVFMQQLLSASAQKKLEAAGTLPVIPGLNVYTEDGCRAAMYALLCKGAALPGAGERMNWIFSRQKRWAVTKMR